MENKTLTDVEMMIFAFTYVNKRKQLTNNVSIEENEKILMCFLDALNHAISIRQNADYIFSRLTQFQSVERELEVLRKILGQEPE